MSRTADRIRLMKAICDHWGQGAGTVPSPSDLLGIEPSEQRNTYWNSIIGSLEDEGLVRTNGGYGLTRSGFPTPAGEEWLEQILDRRESPAERRKAVMKGLLRWLDVQDRGQPSWVNIGPALSVFDLMGSQITETEVRRGANRLIEEKLVECSDDQADPPRLRITALGQRCVESDLDVDAFLEQVRSREPSVQNIFSGQFTGSNIAASSSSFSQTLTNTSDAGDEARILARAVLQALPVLSLDQAVEDSVRRNLEVIQAELEQPEQNGEVIRGLFRRVAEGVTAGAGSALGTALNVLVKFEMQRMGLSID